MRVQKLLKMLEKTKAVEDYVTQAVSNGQGIFKAISLVNRVRQ